jgi:DMSO/TMAO reductase YedYZ molybdopterin-dependent catalytic subunit
MADEKAPEASGGIKKKLVASKERWAREGRLLTGKSGTDRLPPGQRQVTDWPILDLGIRPKPDLARWNLSLDGRIAKPLRWSWAEFQAQPMVDSVSDIHCVTAWSRFDNRWRGISSRHLLALAEPLSDARFVIFHSDDGYSTNVPLADFAGEDVLLASHWNGQPLAPEHGGPLRVVVPRLYFWKSAKWIRQIEFVDVDRPGFWEERGYHRRGDPWREERYG